MKRTIITVVGKDTVGIIARVCTYLAENNVNILDISQTIVQGFFNMMMITNANEAAKDFGELAKELKKAGKPVVLVLVNGRPLELNRLEPVSDAILEIWQPGVNGALPMAGILSGRINPSGKLAMTFPYSTGQIPIYYNRRKSGRGHQGFYKDITSDPLYPFGHGLSYTEFKYGTVTPSATKVKRGEKLSAEVTVTNIGARDGAETVHWFISDPYCSITRPVKELKHFEKQLIKAGETKTFRFDIDLERDFGFVNEDGKRFLEAGEYHILVQGQTVKIELID